MKREYFYVIIYNYEKDNIRFIIRPRLGMKEYDILYVDSSISKDNIKKEIDLSEMGKTEMFDTKRELVIGIFKGW